MPNVFLIALFCGGLAAFVAMAQPAQAKLLTIWPQLDAPDSGDVVSFKTTSPFALSHVGAAKTPETTAKAILFLPDDLSKPVPAVILLHGAGGVLAARELTYGRQYAAMGVAALVVDVFGARGGRGRGFARRLIDVTEAMMLADAFAGLEYLAGLDEVDGNRIALVGFSYGCMATTYAAHAQVNERYAPGGPRFAAHVAFYAPCIVRFADSRATGAPILFVDGGRDAIVDPARCAEVDADLRSGGAPVQRLTYPEGHHQWDGAFPGSRMIGRNLAPCRFRVESSGSVQDLRTGLMMSNRWLRIAALALCVGREGYLIGRDDDVRAQSNRDVARFLNPVLFPGHQAANH